MDTIVLCRAVKQNDWYYGFYEQLLSSNTPEGLVYWKRDYAISGTTCFFLKINCHTICQATNITQEDLEYLKDEVSDWLDTACLSLDDFAINRIDYDYNAILPSWNAKLVMNILKLGTPFSIMHMQKDVYPNSIYYTCTSRHVQLYRKDIERVDKNEVIKPWEADVLREEVQCFSSHIKHMKRYRGLLPLWDNWVCKRMEEDYLRNTRPIFPQEDFYSLSESKRIVLSSPDLTTTKKNKLCKDLDVVASHIAGLSALKDCYNSINTYKDHLQEFQRLGINPITIPDSEGVRYLKNPLFR